ncbi:polynucleotide adenylyltransferase PcnB [Marinomonas sp. M1K-6]|uniref:Poly(A) polymerase I n=1 Tax=Marinomonas profundi TaxID=2726122 RepID=A0A847RCX5_9GAMM|nr:polynucleotide adenylyltransferase PcnB [Marinomonas profundi]NLQ18040.1 polynucleotide adenylyltransferase PcnB [Marinomonas profundi]UDV01761.1 polynucleotide adenylyltransferase PcnB [Marinomonas profundi]
MLTGLKSLVRKATSLFASPKVQTYPIIIPRSDHSLSRQDLSPNAVKVLYRLNKAGYDAYLVGGCVRDHLIGIEPKDFDVVTNATPEEVHTIFSNSRLIGRRFKLVHVTFGREIIEVSTFRAPSAQDDNDDDDTPTTSLKGKDSARSAHGIVLRDNVYGNIEEDAERRDFTFNALYYNVQDFSIHDFCGGLKDIENKQIRMIGDARQRYQEDPVRMLRAIRFAGKLGFEIEADTAAPIKEMAHLLDHIPPARLFEEVLKLLGSGNGIETFALLRQYGLFRYLFPDTDALLQSGWKRDDIDPEAFILQGLKNTDDRIQSGKTTAPYFLYAVLLWPSVALRHEEFQAQGMPATPALHQAANMVLDNQVASTAIPRRFSTPMREIWDMQYRLPKRYGKRAFLLLEHPRFRAGFDFLLIRELSGTELDGLGDWWEKFQHATESQQRDLIKSIDKFANDKEGPKKRRPRRRRKNNSSAPQRETSDE